MHYLFSPWRILAECATPPPWVVVAAHPDAEAFVTRAVHDLLSIAGDAGLTAPGRVSAFASALGRVIDVDHVTDVAPGRCGSKLSPARRRAFAAALGPRVGLAYDGRLWRGPVDGVTLLGSSRLGADDVVVSFAIEDGRAFAPVQMSWRVLRSTGGWRLIDVECRGVWLAGAGRAAQARRSRE